jgi:hypothetical protein
MRFEITQRYTSATPDAVVGAYTDPDLYPTLTGLTKVAAPEVVSRAEEGDQIALVLRMRFVAELNAAARAVVDPAKLTWLQEERYDARAGTARVVFRPENYADRFSSEGGYRFVTDPDEPTATIRTVHGDLRVRMLLVGGQVEAALVSGLREHFTEEQPLVQHWLDDRDVT